MKTVEQTIKDYYTRNGMSDSQIESVIKDLKLSLAGTFNNWDSSMDAYSGTLENLLMTNAKQTAYEWLLENKPQAWFINIFKS